MAEKRFLTPDQLKERFGFGKDWQAKRRSKSCPPAHKIPFIKIGGFVRYDEALIEKWLESHTIVGLD